MASVHRAAVGGVIAYATLLLFGCGGELAPGASGGTSSASGTTAGPQASGSGGSGGSSASGVASSGGSGASGSAAPASGGAPSGSSGTASGGALSGSAGSGSGTPGYDYFCCSYTCAPCCAHLNPAVCSGFGSGTIVSTGSSGAQPASPVDAGQVGVGQVDAAQVDMQLDATPIDAGWFSIGAGWHDAGLSGSAQCALPAQAATRWIAFDSTFGTANRDIYVARADGSALIRLTTDASNEQQPAFSNDGRRLAFASDRTGTMQIYLMDLASYQVTELTTAGGDEPAWSPNDDFIAFHNGSLSVMFADGSHSHAVGTPGVGNFSGGGENPVFTADGTGLVFNGPNSIGTIGLDGTGFRYIIPGTTTTIGGPSLSPDGASVAFSYVPGVQEIGVVPFLGSSDAYMSKTLVTGTHGSARKPAWGPANVIAFEDGQVISGWQIVEASIALSTGPGTPPCELAGAQTDSRNPAWAPAAFQPAP